MQDAKSELSACRAAVDAAAKALLDGDRRNLGPWYSDLLDAYKANDTTVSCVLDAVLFVQAVEGHLNGTAKVDLDYLNYELRLVRHMLDQAQLELR